MKDALTYLLLFTLFCFSSFVHAKELTPVEKNIRHYLDQHQTEQLALIEKVVNINSGTNNRAGVYRVGELLRPEFEKLGFKTYWVEEPSTMKRAGTLIAERQGTHGKRLLLIGHLDTVFQKESAFQKFKRSGNYAHGPGVVDCKGGDIVMLYALKALHEMHQLDDVTITVALMGDEEDAGKPTSISRKPLFDAARHADIALDFECAHAENTASIARKGIAQWRLETQGISAHSAGIFHSAGHGAIYELSRILDAMRIKLAKEPHLTFSPGLILGGNQIDLLPDSPRGQAFGKENVIAKKAIAKGDLRFLTQAQFDYAKKEMQKIVARHLPGTQAIITFTQGIPSMPPTQKNADLLQKYSEVSQDLKLGSVIKLSADARGAGDISHIAAIVSANLAGLGPVGENTHSEQEFLHIKSLPTQTQRAAILILRLTQAPNESA